MNKLSVAIIAVLLAIIAAMGWLFFFRGSVTTADDGRTAVILQPSDRNLLLTEMRGFLEAVQTIIAATEEGDMKTVAETATKVGKVDMAAIPPSLMRALPAEFSKMGFDTHAQFRKLAEDVAAGKGRDHIYKALAEVMNNCITCHASYRADLGAGK